MNSNDFYWSESGDPKVRDGGLLGRYLETDVQGSIEVGRAGLDYLERGRDGEELSGNAHTLRIDADAVYLECDFTDETGSLSLAAFQGLVRTWCEFLDRGPG